GQQPRAAGGVADQHAPGAHALDHDEVPVAAVVEQHDRRQPLVQQPVQRHLEAIGLVALRLQVGAHVQQRKSLALDARLVPALVHVAEHVDFADDVPVLEGQQGGHRGRAAAEIVLLRDRGPVARGLQAGHRHRIAAAVGNTHLGRRGTGGAWRYQLRAKAGRQQQDAQRGAGRVHGSGPPNCTLTAVPFWISTLAPLFWITVLMPAALPKAPPVTMFRPPTVPTAVLPSTLPWLSTSTTTTLSDSPPRMASRAWPGIAWPKPSTATGSSTGDASANAPAMMGITMAGMACPPCQRATRRGPCTRGARPCPDSGTAHVEVGLHGHALLDQRGGAAVLRQDHDARGRVGRTVHGVGHVEGAAMGPAAAAIA